MMRATTPPLKGIAGTEPAGFYHPTDSACESPVRGRSPRPPLPPPRASVGVDRRRHVLQRRAHLDRERGLGDQLRGLRADNLRAEDEPGLVVGDEPDEPSV